MTVEISDRFIVVDIDPASSIEGPSATVALQNGRIMLVGNDYTSHSDIHLGVLDPNSGTLTSRGIVNPTTFGEQDAPEAVQLANGTVLVAWTDNSATAPDFSGDTVRFRLFNAAGQAQSGEFTAPSSMTGDQGLIQAVALEDGRFALVWEDSGRNERVFQIFNADGSRSGGEHILPHGFGDLTGGSVTTYGTNGLAAVGVVSVSGGGYALMLQRYTAAGNPSGDAVQVITGASFRDEHIVELANGGFALVWTDASLTPPYNKGPVVRAQVIDAAGHTVGGVITLSDDIFSEHQQPQITALGDGRFAVTWSMFPDNDFLNTDVVTRIVNADGSFASDVLTVFDSSASYPEMRGGNVTHLESVSELPDGRLVYSFSTLDPSGSSFRAAVRIVDPRDALDVTLHEGNDAFTGTRFADRIDGAGGNDSIDGAAGDDLLSGGTGNDTINGGEGRDTINGGVGDDVLTGGTSSTDLRDVIYGGDGNDTIDGGYGNDELRGDGGNDQIEGGFGADTLIGGAGNDSLSGSALGDVLFGGDGDDFLNGGFGFDRLNGGTGADRFFHLGIAAHGSDWVQDFNDAEGDMLVFGGAGATRSQFQVNFASTAGAGDADVQEAFVIYRPTGQIVWALVDGAGQDALHINIGGVIYDLFA